MYLNTVLFPQGVTALLIVWEHCFVNDVVLGVTLLSQVNDSQRLLPLYMSL